MKNAEKSKKLLNLIIKEPKVNLTLCKVALFRLSKSDSTTKKPTDGFFCERNNANNCICNQGYHCGVEPVPQSMGKLSKSTDQDYPPIDQVHMNFDNFALKEGVRDTPQCSPWLLLQLLGSGAFTAGEVAANWKPRGGLLRILIANILIFRWRSARLVQPTLRHPQKYHGPRILSRRSSGIYIYGQVFMRPRRLSLWPV